MEKQTAFCNLYRTYGLYCRRHPVLYCTAARAVTVRYRYLIPVFIELNIISNLYHLIFVIKHSPSFPNSIEMLFHSLFSTTEFLCSSCEGFHSGSRLKTALISLSSILTVKRGFKSMASGVTGKDILLGLSERFVCTVYQKGLRTRLHASLHAKRLAKRGAGVWDA